MRRHEEVKAEADRLSEESQDSICWRMDPVTAYYHQAVMNGDGDDTVETGGGSAVMLEPETYEREAFGFGATWPEDRGIILHYSSNGGAPEAEYGRDITKEEWDRFVESNSSEVEGC